MTTWTLAKHDKVEFDASEGKVAMVEIDGNFWNFFNSDKYWRYDRKRNID